MLKTPRHDRRGAAFFGWLTLAPRGIKKPGTRPGLSWAEE